MKSQEELEAEEEENKYANALIEFLNSMVIKIDSFWKKCFDTLIILCSIYLVISNAFYAAFRAPTDDYEYFLDIIMEIVFFLDMLFNLFQEFLDEETYQIVSEFTKISGKYVSKAFVIDLIAWIPYDYLFFRD